MRDKQTNDRQLARSKGPNL